MGRLAHCRITPQSIRTIGKHSMPRLADWKGPKDGRAKRSPVEETAQGIAGRGIEGAGAVEGSVSTGL